MEKLFKGRRQKNVNVNPMYSIQDRSADVHEQIEHLNGNEIQDVAKTPKIPTHRFTASVQIACLDH